MADRTSQYAEAVVAGDIVAGPNVRNACRRHLQDLQDGHKRGITFDPEAAQWVFDFFEQTLTLSEGQFDGLPFQLHESQAFIVGSLFGWKRANGTRRFQRAYVEQGKGNGKALALDTPIPTPSGWTTMGELREGSEVIGADGVPCRVLVAHPVSEDRDCYRITFDDGEQIVASAEHLWRTEMRHSGSTVKGAAIKGVPRNECGAWRQGLRTTADIAWSLHYANGKYQSANHSIVLAGALDLPEAALPIEPYGLGVWLGDGDSDCARVTIGDRDAEATVGALVTAGWIVCEKRGGKRYRIEGLQVKLRAAGLLMNKHIPAEYMRASKAQRLALLQGLMDTDGCISKKGQCEFTQVKRGLAEQVHELAISLGLKATMSEGLAKIDGRTIGPKYRVMFNPEPSLPVFRIPRKLERQAAQHSRRRLSADRRIVACDLLAPVPARCITVNSPDSMFLAGRSMVPTHNSPLAGGIGLYGMTADGEAGAQIYAAAAKRDQAAILFADAVKMVRQSPALAKRIEFSGGVGREYNMAHHRSGSFFRPVSRDTGKSGSGPRPYFVLADEVHELPDGKILEMLERGFKFRRQPLLFMITNSGSDRNSVAWHEHEWAVKVAAGHEDAVTDPTFIGRALDDDLFSYVCALDGPRVELFAYNDAITHLKDSCTCHSAQTIQIEKLLAGACAKAAITSGTGWKVELDALITQIEQSLSPDFAALATTRKKREPLKDGQKSGNTKSDGLTKTSPDSKNTSGTGSVSDPDTDLPSKLSKRFESSELSSLSASSLLSRMANALSAVESQTGFASTIATQPGNIEGFSASSAILQSVFSGIIHELWKRHSPTCEVRKTELAPNGLKVNLPADDPLNDPSCWAKANPLLGVTITEDYLAGVVAQAKNIPTKQNNILRLHFCMWTDSDVAWMSREVVEPLMADFDPAEHKGKEIACGLDLSQNRDITAQGNCVQTGEREVEVVEKDGTVKKVKKPTFDIWLEAWTPGDTMQERAERDKLPYPVWARQGFIHAPSGENISYLHVAQTLVEYDRDYKIQMVAYDRYAFRRFEEDAAQVGLTVNFVEHPQGGTKKGKPTAEMEANAKRDGKHAEGLWFPGSLRLLEDAMLEGRVRFRRNPVLISAIMSAVVERDKWDNAWLSKAKSVNKIDPIVAVVMAFGAANATAAKSQPLLMFTVG